MASRKRATSEATIVVPPSPSTPVSDDQLYVLLPLPPDVVLAIREHVDNGSALLDLFARITEVPPADLVGAIRRAASAVDRDVKRIRRARSRRR